SNPSTACSLSRERRSMRPISSSTATGSSVSTCRSSVHSRPWAMGRRFDCPSEGGHHDDQDNAGHGGVAAASLGLCHGSQVHGGRVHAPPACVLTGPDLLLSTQRVR